MTSIQLPENVAFLLFDMDGTLVDTEPVGPQNFIDQLNKYKIRPTIEEIAFFTKVWRRDGTDIKEDDYLAQITEKYDINIQASEYIKEFFSMYEQAIIQAKPLVGVDDFLRSAKACGNYKLAIVTASKLSQVQAIL